MFPTVLPAPADRFARVIDLLCRAIAAHSAGAPRVRPLLLLVWSRLRRMAVRFARLAARVQAGAPPATRPRPARSGPPPKPLPRGFAWLVRLVPATAASAAQLQHLLADPEMAALIAAAPQAGRILRPLCRMLGIRPPPGLSRPPPAAPAAPSRPAATGRAPPPASPRDRPPRPPPDPTIGPHTIGPPVPA